MTQSFIVLLPVQTEFVTLAEAKQFCRVVYSDEDDLLGQLITDARVYGENLTKRALATQTIQAIVEPTIVPNGPLSGPVVGIVDAWAAAERPDIPLFGNMAMRLKLPMSPVQSMTTVEYQLTRMDQPEWQTLAPTDVNGNPNYRIDTIASPSEINIFTIVAASRWRFTYQAGYTALPSEMRRAMLSLISFWFNNREGQAVPSTIDDQFRLKRVFQL